MTARRHRRRSGSRERPAGSAPAVPIPAGLAAYRLGGEDAEFVLFAWPGEQPMLPSVLTAAERAVAALALAGLSNREIARRRATAERTTANQLASVFRKLGAGSRRELAVRLTTTAVRSSAGKRSPRHG